MESLLGVSRVAFTIKNFEIYWYGIFICIGILLAFLVACLYVKKKGYDTNLVINLALIILPTGILGARLFSVIFEKSLSFSDFFNFRDGGLSIIGAILGGGLGLLIYSFFVKDKKKIGLMFDVLVVGLILAQSIGRWGNYFNQEVYGIEYAGSSLFMRFPFAVNVGGTYYFALFFYESLFDFVGFVILSLVFFGEGEDLGKTTAIYLIYYGIVRTGLEFLRNPSFILYYKTIKVSQLFSIIMVVVGIILISVLKSIYKKRRLKKA